MIDPWPPDGARREDHGVKCPHCGAIRTDDLYDYDEGEVFDMWCGSCDGKFKMRTFVTHSYYSWEDPAAPLSGDTP